MSSKPVQIALFLPSSHPLARTLERHQKILHVVRQALPAFLSEHCFGCVIKEDELLVYTDSSVWASQLRFYRTALLDAVRSFCCPAIINHIQIRISATDLRQASPQRKSKTPPGHIIAGIESAARISSDSKMSDALLRLAKALERRS